MRYISHLNSAVQLLEGYKADGPFSFFIKDFFKQNKKYGSTDRKTIAHLCYCYFRLGTAIKTVGLEEKILIGLFLCNHSTNDLLKYYRPEWDEQIGEALQKKLSIINHPFLPKGIFPWKEALSETIDYEKFCESFLVQPDLFLRVRPGFELIVKEKLVKANLGFVELGSSCIALENGTKIEELVQLNKEAVVQDYSSQKVADFFESHMLNQNSPRISVWDCCAASGGKSIMAKDLLGKIDLTVSDMRASIMANLRKRFEEAGIKKYHSHIVDLTIAQNKLPKEKYDLVIADLPCSGSGTWGRSPESLCFFDEKKIEAYSLLQKRILTNIVPSLKKNAALVYITCSVFKKENEEIVDFIHNKLGLRLEKKELLRGYDKKADSMFAARFSAGTH